MLGGNPPVGAGVASSPRLGLRSHALQRGEFRRGLRPARRQGGVSRGGGPPDVCQPRSRSWGEWAGRGEHSLARGGWRDWALAAGYVPPPPVLPRALRRRRQLLLASCELPRRTVRLHDALEIVGSHHPLNRSERFTQRKGRNLGWLQAEATRPTPQQVRGWGEVGARNNQTDTTGCLLLFVAPRKDAPS